VEQLGEALLPVLGVELIVLLDRHPGQGAALLLDLVVALGLLALELRELSSRRLPFLAGAGFVLGHLGSSLIGTQKRLEAGLKLIVRGTRSKPFAPEWRFIRR